MPSDFLPSGAAGHSGDYAVAMLQFNNREWMVELVTEPGRLYCIRSGTIPKPGTACLWESRKLGEHESHQSNAPQESSARFPTVPDASGEEVPERTSSSGTASSGQKDGLQWSELDGLTMDELVPSEHTEVPPRRGPAKSFRFWQMDGGAHKAVGHPQLAFFCSRRQNLRRRAFGLCRTWSCQQASVPAAWNPRSSCTARILAHGERNPQRKSATRLLLTASAGRCSQTPAQSGWTAWSRSAVADRQIHRDAFWECGSGKS